MSRPKTVAGSIDIGISAADRKNISRGLSFLLADSYTLYLMTHSFHWSVTGPQSLPPGGEGARPANGRPAHATSPGA